MAATIEVKASNMRPVKAGFEFVEVTLKEDEVPPDTNGRNKTSDIIPLGKSYRSIKPVAVGNYLQSNANIITYAENSIFGYVVIVDNSSIRIVYNHRTAPSFVTVTLECEV